MHENMVYVDEESRPRQVMNPKRKPRNGHRLLLIRISQYNTIQYSLNEKDSS